MFKTMLVEDSASFRQLLKDTIQDQFPSMDVMEAADGLEAFQKIDSHPPNLIFMDIHLPGENGLELTRKIKADYPDVMIIILTSHDFSAVQIRVVIGKSILISLTFLTESRILQDRVPFQCHSELGSESPKIKPSETLKQVQGDKQGQIQNIIWTRVP